MVDILNIGGEPSFDDRIIRIETHTYNLYVNTTFGHSDEIRILIQQQNLCTLSCENFLNIEGRLTSNKENADQQPTLGCNCIAFIVHIIVNMIKILEQLIKFLKKY